MGMKAITLAIIFIIINLSISWMARADIFSTGSVPYDSGSVSYAENLNNSGSQGSWLNNLPIVNAIPQAQTMFSMLGGLLHSLSFDWIKMLLPAQLENYWLTNLIVLGFNSLFLLLIMLAVIEVLSSTVGRFTP